MLLSAPEPAGQPLWQVMAVTAIPALAAVIAAFIAGRYAKSSKSSEHEAQRLRDLESRISDRKYETYKPMIALFGDILNKEKAAEVLSGQNVPTRLHEFATWASIYASDDAVRAFRDLMQASYTDAPAPVILRLYCEFVLSARRDIGHSDTTTTAEEVLAMRVNDLYEDDGLRWVVREPFQEVCRRANWSPPWAC
ncbi:hypothetical protein ABZU25_10120 [Micromonospora sp. NPDC005215]|uniref:hypothetical protein n=1 Tax=Micromonospora sp. NPDC005215 TaxID=3157024 RepID=UPI0033AC94DB